ncbi:hypothetical protein [Actinomadura xylanilytica]|uniref:hypothetical protein n=1 Tax=Actinomadura xylanilytica TaxID=887459 RepID=UPI00255B0D5C|nr:hypothetical protein [Actinomadura xylanilytica]MDL4776884.1 hypothetical protein [Actinomadura xylanilytica]
MTDRTGIKIFTPGPIHPDERLLVWRDRLPELAMLGNHRTAIVFDVSQTTADEYREAQASPSPLDFIEGSARAELRLFGVSTTKPTAAPSEASALLLQNLAHHWSAVEGREVEGPLYRSPRGAHGQTAQPRPRPRPTARTRRDQLGDQGQRDCRHLHGARDLGAAQRNLP